MVAALTFQPPAAGTVTGVMRLRQADKLMMVELIAMIDTPRGVELRFRHFTGALDALETTFKQTMLLKTSRGHERHVRESRRVRQGADVHAAARVVVDPTRAGRNGGAQRHHRQRR